MQPIIKTIQIKLNAKEWHQAAIEHKLSICKEFYNFFLEQRIDHYQKIKEQKLRIENDKKNNLQNYEEKIKNLSSAAQQRSIKYIRNIIDPDHLIYSRSIQNICERVSLAYDHFFRRVREKSGKAGFPKFKEHYKSISFNEYNKGFSIICDANNFIDKVIIYNIGSVKVFNRFALPKEAKILTATLIKKQDGYYFCITYSSATALPLPSKKSKPLFPHSNIEHKENIKNEIGVDLGIRDFITTSDGDKINCKALEAEYNKLKSFNKQLKHKKKILKKNNTSFASSRRYRNLQLKISKQHLKIARIRADFHQKAANYILSNYKNVYMEELNIQKIIKKSFSRDFARRIHSASWNSFFLKLDYKVKQLNNSKLEKINPAWTSQICNICGQATPTALHKKVFKCSHCGSIEDRDVNAAKNILILGTEGPLALAVPRAWLMDNAAKNAAKAAKLKAEAPSSKNQ